MLEPVWFYDLYTLWGKQLSARNRMVWCISIRLCVILGCYCSNSMFVELAAIRCHGFLQAWKQKRWGKLNRTGSRPPSIGGPAYTVESNWRPRWLFCCHLCVCMCHHLCVCVYVYGFFPEWSYNNHRVVRSCQLFVIDWFVCMLIISIGSRLKRVGGAAGVVW